MAPWPPGPLAPWPPGISGNLCRTILQACPDSVHLFFSGHLRRRAISISDVTALGNPACSSEGGRRPEEGGEDGEGRGRERQGERGVEERCYYRRKSLTIEGNPIRGRGRGEEGAAHPASGSYTIIYSMHVLYVYINTIIL